MIVRSPAADVATPPAGAAPITSPTVQRSVEPTVRRAETATDTSSVITPPVSTNGSTAGTGTDGSPTALADRIDELMAELEERVLIELERRGGRFAGYF
ncbi:MAG: hypothetical protein ACRD2W_23605, partial [Acidimicrobiales bacterium]